MISENSEGFSDVRLDVCILAFVGCSGAETNEWQQVGVQPTPPLFECEAFEQRST